MQDNGLIDIRIRGFCSLADVMLVPGRLTVLIGPNGAGKSNVLTALKLLPQIPNQSLQRFVGEAGGASTLLHYGPKKTPFLSLECNIQYEHNNYNYLARLGFAAGDRLMFLEETIRHHTNDGPEPTTVSLGTGHWESQLRENENSVCKIVNNWLEQITFFHFHDTSLSSPLRTTANASDDQFLRSDGSNLAAYLMMLKQSEQDACRKAWYRIQHLVRRVAPSIKELRPTFLQQGKGHVRLDWVDDQDEVFGVHQLSDGTLRAIALMTALAQPTERLPHFISIDEPELGLHPAAIHLLAEQAHSIARHTQILFATQSTTFLDLFDPSEVIVTERKNGVSSLRRLQSETLQSWLEEYSLSDLFHKGVLGGRP